MKGTLPEQRNTAQRRVFTITRVIFLLTGTFVQSLEIDTVLQGALLDEVAFGDAGVFAYEAVGKSQRSNGRGARSNGSDFASIRRERKVCSAEHEDVANTLFGAVFTFDCGGLVGYTDETESVRDYPRRHFVKELDYSPGNKRQIKIHQVADLFHHRHDQLP